jgi:SAM-dependent methyltransferase
VTGLLGAAYSAGASAWADGPARVYGRLAELLVAFSPDPLAGRSTLDLGTGTGLGARAAQAAGARVVAVDLARGMLCPDRDRRPPAVVGDARALPFRSGALDVVLAPFSLNHLDDPAVGVREAGRVGRLLVASTYAADDDHPVKAAVETALVEQGWCKPRWYTELKAGMAAWGTVDGVAAVMRQGGLRPLAVERRSVAFDLNPSDMVAWRLGLAHCAGFVAGLDPVARQRLSARALALLGPDSEPVIRRVIFAAAAH